MLSGKSKSQIFCIGKFPVLNVLFGYMQKKDRKYIHKALVIGSQIIFLFVLSYIFYHEQILHLQSEKSICILLRLPQFGFSNWTILFMKWEGRWGPCRRTLLIGFLVHGLFLTWPALPSWETWSNNHLPAHSPTFFTSYNLSPSEIRLFICMFSFLKIFSLWDENFLSGERYWFSSQLMHLEYSLAAQVFGKRLLNKQCISNVLQSAPENVNSCYWRQKCISLHMLKN